MPHSPFLFFWECEHFISTMTDTITTMVKITEAAIASPIRAAMLSIVVVVNGVVDGLFGVGVTITVPDDSCGPGVSPDPSPEPSGGVVVQLIGEGKSITITIFTMQKQLPFAMLVNNINTFPYILYRPLVRETM